MPPSRLSRGSSRVMAFDERTVTRTAVRTGRRRRSVTRHRQLLHYFGETGVASERDRYRRSTSMQHRRELIERFLAAHLRGRPRSCLEVGPGAGRFSDLLRRRCRNLVLLDLSRPMLEASRRHLERQGAGRTSLAWVRGSLEELPFLPASFDRVVALGVLPFVARDLSRVLRRLGTLLRPRGRVVFEIQTPSQATMSNLPAAARSAQVLLREPARHHVWSVIRRGYQPHDPAHLARFEFVWLRPPQLTRELRHAGLRVVDQMAIGPNFANQPELLQRLRRDRRAYSTAIRIEEEMGRWPELFGAGAGLLVTACRRARSARGA
jgi:ubiquinone/menaquinone biosynthesis C-methylase UbiE